MSIESGRGFCHEFTQFNRHHIDKQRRHIRGRMPSAVSEYIMVIMTRIRREFSDEIKYEGLSKVFIMEKMEWNEQMK